MKPLLKVPYVNIPVSVPEDWRDFFDDQARFLGISRNAAFCLAMKLGAPILEKYGEAMRREVRAMRRRLVQCSEILPHPATGRPGVKRGHERRNATSGGAEASGTN